MNPGYHLVRVNKHFNVVKRLYQHNFCLLIRSFYNLSVKFNVYLSSYWSGGTRDIGMSFTKIVLRHKAIESKLKMYVG